AIIVTALAPALVSWLIFRSREFHDLALLTAVGILTDLLLRSVLGFLQASERFGPFMMVNATWQLVRAGCLIGLIIASVITATSAVVIYIFAPLLAFAIGIT